MSQDLISSVPYSIVDSMGRVLMSGRTLGSPPVGEGQFLLAEEAPSIAHYRDQEQWIPIPDKPSINHIFNWVTKQWEDLRSLQDFKEAQWELVKAQRSNAEFSVFRFQGVYYDCDRVSQSRIQGAVQLASIALANNQTVVQEWTTADNSVVSLDATDLLGLGLQLGFFVNKVHSYGRVLRTRIDEATTLTDVQNVLWDEAEFDTIV